MPTEPNIFLNRMGEMTRQMTGPQDSFQIPKPTLPRESGAKARMEADMLLNHSVLKRGKQGEQEAYVVSLQEEIKGLKQKMEFARETDEALYKLKCENERLRVDYGDLQKETVTDFTLKRDHDELLLKCSGLEEALKDQRTETDTLQQENQRLKQSLLALHGRSSHSHTSSDISCTLNVDALKRQICERKKMSYESRVDYVLSNYRYTDNQRLTQTQLSQVIRDILQGE
jgi:hypothetical protein